MKPLASEIMNKFSECGFHTSYEPTTKSILEFFDWAYNEGKKEANSHRNPTKMELATT